MNVFVLVNCICTKVLRRSASCVIFVLLIGCSTLTFDNQRLRDLLESENPSNAGFICGEITKFLYSNNGPLAMRTDYQKIEDRHSGGISAKATVEFSRSGYRSSSKMATCDFSLDDNASGSWISLIGLDVHGDNISDRHVDSLNEYIQALMV